MAYSVAEQKLVDTVINYKELEFQGEDPLDLIVEALTDGANLFVTIQDVDLLTYAVNKENIDLVEFLLEVSYKGQKFDLNKHINARDTLLTQLLRSPFAHPDLAEMLIEAGADVNKTDVEGLSPLILAVQHEKTSDVEMLINAGADVNYITPKTEVSPFLVACQGTSVSTVQLMLDKGVNINTVNPVGLNGLMLGLNAFGMYATKEDKKNRKKIVNLLLDSGIDVNHVGNSGLTALWSSVGFWKEMDKITRLGGDLYAVHNFPQSNPMPFAHMIMAMQVVKVKQVVKNKGDTDKDVAEAQAEDDTPGEFFANLTREAIFNDFRSGVQDSEGNTLEAIVATNPLLVKNYKESVLKVLKDIQINQVYKTSVTQTHQKSASVPMLSSVFNNFNELEIQSLLKGWKESGQSISLNVADPTIDLQHQPLFVLLTTGKLKTLLRVVKEEDISINELEFVGKKKNKKYHIAEVFQNVIQSSGLNVIKNELANTTNILNGIEINRQNGVKSDVFADEAAVERQLMKNKKDLEKKLDVFLKYQEQAADTLRYLGLDFNKINDKGFPVVFSVENKDVIELFEKMGTDISKKANNGDTILVNALLNGLGEVVEYVSKRWSEESNPLLGETLLQTLYHGNLNERLQQSTFEPMLQGFLNLYGKEETLEDNTKKIVYDCPFINQKDEDGNTPLLIAAANDYLYVMKPLIKAGADINAKNENGETAIMHAIANENFPMVKFLFENKVDINVENNDGVNIDDLLEDIEDKELVKMVRSYQNDEFNPETAKVTFKKR